MVEQPTGIYLIEDGDTAVWWADGSWACSCGVTSDSSEDKIDTVGPGKPI